MFRWLTSCIALLALPSPFLIAEESIEDLVDKNRNSFLPAVSFPDTGKLSYVELADAKFLMELRGDPRSLQFSGLNQVAITQLQSALAFDLEYQASARKTATLVDFIDTVENRLQVGFLHSGFPNATVSAGYQAETEKIHVVVSEGSQYVNGNIRITEASGLNGIELADAIRTPTEKCPWTYQYGKNEVAPSKESTLLSPAWKVGAATQFDKFSIKQLTTCIRELITDQGFPFALFKVDLVPEDEGKASLVVEIEDAGSRAQLTSIRIEGLQRHSSEDVLSYLDIETGISLNGKVLREIHSKLRNSCRFWNYDVLVRFPPVEPGRYVLDTEEVELVISLVEYSHVPPLGKPLLEAEEVMKRAAQWLEGYVARGDAEIGDLVVEVTENPQEDQEKPTGLHGKIILSPQQGITVDVHYPEDEQLALWHSLVVERDKIAIYDWRQQEKLRVSLGDFSAVVNIKWATGEIVDGEYMNSLFFGFGAKSSIANTTKQALALTMKCEPVAFVNMLHRDDAKYELSDDEMRVQARGLEFRIDKKSGRVIQIALDNSDKATSATGTFSFQKNAFKEHVNQIRSRGELLVDCYEPLRPITSCTAFAIRQLVEQPTFKCEPLCRLMGEQLLRNLDSDWLEEWVSELSWFASLTNESSSRQAEKYDVAFTIPSNDLQRGEDFLDKFWMMLGRVSVPLSDWLFPRGSWPWTFTREMSLKMASSQQSSSLTTGSQAELWASMRSKHTGILGHALLALVWDEFMPSAFSKRIKRHAKKKLSEASYVNDLQYFIRGDHWSAQFFSQVVLMVDKMPNAEKSQFREALSPRLVSVYDSLIARRKSYPSEAASDAVEAVLLELWRSDWQEMLSVKLDHASTETQVPEP